jgi:hypothetical protein
VATTFGCGDARLLILMLDITEHRILKQMVEEAIEIVPHVNQDLDAFRNGSRVVNQIATSRLVHSQDGTQFFRLIMRRYTFVQKR